MLLREEFTIHLWAQMLSFHVTPYLHLVSLTNIILDNTFLKHQWTYLGWVLPGSGKTAELTLGT